MTTDNQSKEQSGEQGVQWHSAAERFAKALIRSNDLDAKSDAGDDEHIDNGEQDKCDAEYNESKAALAVAYLAAPPSQPPAEREVVTGWRCKNILSKEIIYTEDSDYSWALARRMCRDGITAMYEVTALYAHPPASAEKDAERELLKECRDAMIEADDGPTDWTHMIAAALAEGE